MGSRSARARIPAIGSFGLREKVTISYSPEVIYEVTASLLQLAAARMKGHCCLSAWVLWVLPCNLSR